MSQAERVKIIYDHLNIILSTILILAFSVLAVGGLGMASATGINIMERTREIGVMRAIGLLLAWPLSLAGLWITVLTTFVFGWLASRIPAAQAIKVEPWKALSCE